MNAGTVSSPTTVTVTATYNNASKTAQVTVSPSTGAIISVTPSTFNTVFTVGDPAASLGFLIANQSGGPLTGTISAATNSGGSWLTVAGHVSYNWTAPETVNAAANPAGLAAGTYTGSITVTSAGAGNSPIVIPAQMVIYLQLQITTSSLPTAFSGQPYTFQLQGTGGTGTGYGWSLQSGILPLGLTLDSGTGVINGTPATFNGPVTFPLNIVLQDSLGHSTIKSLFMLYEQSLSILPISPSNFQFVVGSPYTSGNSITFQAVGGNPPYTWSAAGLPTGLSISSTTGLVSGTPTQPGNFNASITVRDSSSPNISATQTFTISVIVTQLTISPAVLLSGTVGVAYDQYLNAAGGSQSNYTWSVQGSLPMGLASRKPPTCTSTYPSGEPIFRG